MTALYVAKTVIEADPTGRAVVLVVCAEACSVHLSSAPQLEAIVGNTIFADGAACAIVTNAGFRGAQRTPSRLTRSIVGDDWEWAIGAMSSEIVPNSAGAMTWRQSEESGRYDMWLSRDIPSALTDFFVSRGLEIMARVGILNPFGVAWALHPGGKSIILGFEKALVGLGLGTSGISASQDVLKEHGNMSSATIFFVLQRVLSTTDRDNVFFAGFGPGLTVEFGALHRTKTNQKGDIEGVKGDAEQELPSDASSATASGDEEIESRGAVEAARHK